MNDILAKQFQADAEKAITQLSDKPYGSAVINCNTHVGGRRSVVIFQKRENEFAVVVLVDEQIDMLRNLMAQQQATTLAQP